MDETLLRKELIKHEGIRYEVYEDSLGYPTAGIGHLLQGDETSLAIGTKVSDAQIEEWFKEDIADAVRRARLYIMGVYFDSLDDVRQVVIVDMAFNLGPKLSNFTRFIKAVRGKDYDTAAKEMLNSEWAKQVKGRAVELSKAMQYGHFG